MKPKTKKTTIYERKRTRLRQSRSALILALGYLTKCRRTGADLRGGPAAILGI